MEPFLACRWLCCAVAFTTWALTMTWLPTVARAWLLWLLWRQSAIYSMTHLFSRLQDCYSWLIDLLNFFHCCKLRFKENVVIYVMSQKKLLFVLLKAYKSASKTLPKRKLKKIKILPRAKGTPRKQFRLCRWWGVPEVLKSGRHCGLCNFILTEI